MAIPKTFGIETEYGIVHRGTDEANPITASSLLINAYLAAQGYKPDARSDVIAWDFIDETPGSDARGFSPMGSMPPEVETHLVNAVLRNGARYYVDHAHPEMSTPEVADPLSAVLYDRAGELIGPTITIDDVAEAAGTIPYEILTALGSRYRRRYVG